VAKVAAAPENKRNTTLNDECFDLFSKFVPAGLLSADDVVAAMQDAGEACGLYGDEVPRTITSAWKGGQKKDRTAESPDFVFEVPGQTPADGLVMPGVAAAVYHFEDAYALRRAATGEFIVRAADPSRSPVVTEGGDDLADEVRWWWRQAAETWNAEARQGREEATGAWQAELEAMDPLAQLEVLKKAYFARRAKKDAGEDDEGKRAEVFTADLRISTVMEHLRASASRHDRVVLYTRIVDVPGRVVVDLCDETGRAVVITPGGWDVRDVREVEGQPWFRRNGDMKPQAVPQQPDSVLGTLEQAREVFGVTPEQWKIVLGALVGWHFPSVARPGGWLAGVSGTGKTTRAEMWAGLVDPVEHLGDEIDVRQDKRDARVQAMNHFLVSQDNVSVVSQKDSDFWCRLHTGISDSARKLHSDNTMLTFTFKRVGLGTSVSLPDGFRPDALRRILHIELAVAEDNPALDKLWHDYYAIKPQVLGALYTVIAAVLAHLGKAMRAKLPGCPEMADYARRLHAADLAYPALGDLYEAYRQHTRDVMADKAVDSPLVALVSKLMDSMEALGQDSLAGSPTELHAQLENHAAGLDISQPWWPKDPSWLGRRLKDYDAPLRQLGLVVTESRSKKTRTITITRAAPGGPGAP
jgi:hypothetical protein